MLMTCVSHIDINECMWPNIMDLCKNGQCRNTIGSWNCTCPSKVYTTPKSIGGSGDRRFRCEGKICFVIIEIVINGDS